MQAVGGGGVVEAHCGGLIVVILNEVKNLKTPTLCIQILRFAQDDII